MKYLLTLTCFLSLSLCLRAQDPTLDSTIKNVTIVTDSEQDPGDVYMVVEKMPQFPGGTTAMFDFINKHLKYPKAAIKERLSGRVVVTFIVGKDGQLNDIKVLRDIGGGCGEEAARVVKLMPRWEPGTQRGKPVKVRYNLPFRFEPR